MSDDLIKDEDWLRNDFQWRDDLALAAKALVHWNTNINAIPAYPVNRDRIEYYYSAFDNTLESLKKILEAQNVAN